MKLVKVIKSAQKKLGFTLIELLIVIAILGVLTALVLLAINPAQRLRQARDAGRKSDIAQIATALESYYTTSTTGYPTGAGCPGGLTMLTASSDLKKVPLGPTGENYCYTVVNPGTSSSEAAVWGTLEAPTTGSGTWLWCWRSTSGRAVEVSDGLLLLVADHR